MSIITIFIDIMPRPNKSETMKMPPQKMPRFRTRNARIAGFRQRMVIRMLRMGERFAGGKVMTHASKFADRHLVKQKA